MRGRSLDRFAAIAAGFTFAGLITIAGASPAVAISTDLQPGVSVRLNDFTAVTPSAPEHADHPDLALISVMAPWQVLEPADQAFDLGPGSTMDQNIQDATAGDYRIILRIMAGRLEPQWLVDDPGATTVTLLGTDINASDYCEFHEVVVPWDLVLQQQYTQLLQAIGAWLQQPDGVGGTKGDHVFGVPISMPSFQGTEMNWGYGPGSATCPAGTEGAGLDLSTTNRAAWDALDSETQRRNETKQAWKTAIDLHMSELPASVHSMIAYGGLFGDSQAAALEIAQQKVPMYLTRLWSMYTNLQPKVFADGSLGTYRDWCQPCHDVMMAVSGAGGLLGFQTASVNINDTSAKYHAAVEDGLSTYGMRFLETQPGNIGPYYPFLLTEPNNVQARIRAFDHARPTTTSVSCDPVTIGHPTTCTANVSDVGSGTKIAPSEAGTVTWTPASASGPTTCTPDAAAFATSCSTSYTPAASGIQQVRADYLGDANHAASTDTLSLDVARRTTRTAVVCDATVPVGVAAACTVTVTDTSAGAGGSPPTGQVSWSTSAAGSFAGGTCALAAQPGAVSGCQVAYTGGEAGIHGISASYPGDTGHSPSDSGANVEVTARGTSTSVTCDSPVPVGSASTCTASVTDNGAGAAITPLGTVSWSGGSGFSAPSCATAGAGVTASCSVTSTPSVPGTQGIDATFGATATHATSAGRAQVSAIDDTPPPAAPIALRTSDFAANATVTDLVIPAPGGVQPGDVMVAAVDVKANPSVTPPSGWTLVVATNNGSNLTGRVYTKVATASEPASYRWVFNQTRAASGGILVYSGVSTSQPVEAFGGQTGSSTNIVAPSVTTVTNGAVVLGVFAIANASAISPPAGMTERGEIASSSKIKTEVADLTKATAGATGTKTAVAGSSAANVGQLIVLRPATNVPGGDLPPTFDQDLQDRTNAPGDVVSLLAHATDPENDPLTYDATGLPPGLAIDPSTGRISGSISADAAGASPYAVSVTVSDDGGATIAAVDSFAWTVTPTGGGSGSIALRTSVFAANAVVKDLVIPAPGGVQPGDVMVAAVDVKANPSVTPPSGWTLVVATNNGSNLTGRVYTKVATASEPASYRWVFNQTRAASGGILVYSGVSTSQPVEAFGGQTGSSTNIVAPSVTTVTNGAVVLGVFAIANASAISPPAGMTERGEIASSSKIKTEVADLTKATAGATGTKTAVAGSSAANVGQLIVLRPA